MHAGITEDEIIDFVNQAKEKVQFYHDDRKNILFFDEINTNSSVEGLLKEIVIDGHLLGDPIDKRIVVVAACNPYQLKKLQNTNKNADIAISSGLQHPSFQKRVSNLVYTVLPLPESFFSFIWDYGSLSESEEEKIIAKIISKLSKIGIKQDVLSIIAKCVVRSQAFTRELDAKWAVSLRDVARFTNLCKYFKENNYAVYCQEQKNDSLKKSNYLKTERAIVLSLCFCYLFRIANKQKREEYIKKMVEFTIRISYKLDRHSFQQILEDEYTRYLENMEIPHGIGKNTPLKENIFVIFTCLMNKIPLIITGKPGSSKTLAMNIVTKSLKGKSSQKPFFKELPAVLPFSYQGSLQSTSEGIKRIFDKAINCQHGMIKNKSDTIVMVLFDEIGLAEISPHNSLKVLHSLLEHPKVSVIGLSNWSLDASKMNRTITLSRPDPDEDDLRESADSINDHINENNPEKNVFIKENYLNELVKGYLSYLRSQKSQNFHGLRDFYSMIQQICTNLEVGYDQDDYNVKQENKKIISLAIERNFGGLEILHAHDCIIRPLKFDQFNFRQSSPIKIITENIRDNSSRHLMLITPDSEEIEAISFVEQILKDLNKEYQVFQGSDFPEDKTEEASYRLINDIILCMERGITCILQNLNNIYQSFYDMLNQNYQVVNGQSFCKVAIAADSTRCLVHPDFKCVVVVNQTLVKNLDPPLLNRFEKQQFSQIGQISKDQKGIIKNIEEWLNSYDANKEDFGENRMFPINIKQSSIISLYLHKISIKPEQAQNEEQINTYLIASQIDQDNDDTISQCKKKILQLSSISGNLRQLSSKNDQQASDNKINERYSLVDLLESLKSKNNNLLIYTRSTSGLNDLIDQELHSEMIQLEILNSKRQFETKVKEFFFSTKHNRLIVLASTSKNSIARINLCKSIICSIRIENEKRGFSQQKQICFIIKIEEDQTELIAQFKSQWDEYYVEILNGKQRTNIHVGQLVDMNMQEIFQDQRIFKSLLKLNLASVVSKIQYDSDENTIIEKMNQINQILIQADTEFSNKTIRWFNKLFLEAKLPISEWQKYLVEDKSLMQGKNTFHSAAIEYLSKIFVEQMSYLIYILESDGVISALSINITRSDSTIIDVFEHLFDNEYIQKFTRQGVSQTFNFDFPKSFSLFPFVKHIHGLISTLKDKFITDLSQLSDDSLNRLFGQLHQQLESILPDHYQTLVFNSPESFKHFFNDFPLIIINEFNKRNQNVKSSATIMKIMKILVSNIEPQPTIPDLYALAWTHSDLIYDISHVLNEDDLINDVMRIVSQIFDDKEGIIAKDQIAKECLLAIAHIMKPKVGDDGIWFEKTSKIRRELEDKRSFKHYIQTKEIKLIDLLLIIHQQMVKPFNLNISFLIELANELSDKDPIDQCEDFVEVIADKFYGLSSLQKADSQSLDLARMSFLYDYIDDTLKQIQDPIKIKDFFENCLYYLKQDLTESPNFGNTTYKNLVHSFIKSLFSKLPANFLFDQEYIDLFNTILFNEEYFNIEHPFSVILTDAIQQKLQYDSSLESLRMALHMILSQDEQQEMISSLADQTSSEYLKFEKLVAIAQFRIRAKRMTDAISESIIKNDQDELISEIEAIQVFNEKVSQYDYQIGKPLKVYMLKLLKQKLPNFRSNLNQVQESLQWIQELNLQQDSSNYRRYIIKDDLTHNIIDFINNKSELEKQLPPLFRDSNDMTKITLRLSLMQHYYLNELPPNQLLEARRYIVEFLRAQNRYPDIEREIYTYLIGQRPLQSLCQNARQHFIGQQKDYLAELFTYFTEFALFFDQTTLIGRFLQQPDSLKDIFLPFMPNVKEDFLYQMLFKHEPQFSRYRCRQCRTIFCVVDCGQLSGHRGAHNASQNCLGCGAVVGFNGAANSEKVDQGACAKNVFTTLNEAVQSYILISAENIEMLAVRNLNNSVRRFGSILLHTLFLIPFLFGSHQFQHRIKAYFTQNQSTDQVFDMIFSQIDFAWNNLKKDFQINDDSLLKVTELIILQLFKNQNNPLMNYETFRTIDGRVQFEKFFQENIIPQFPNCLQDNFTNVINDIQGSQANIQNVILYELDEIIDIDSLDMNNRVQQMYSIFRLQNSFTYASFCSYIRGLQKESQDKKVILLTLESQNSFQYLNLLWPLLFWTNLVLKTFSRKVTLEDSLDKSIEQVIQDSMHLSQKEKFQILEHADNFLLSWNSLSHQLREIPEGCDSIQLQRLTRQSKFSFCCITSVNKEHLGYHLFLALKYLALKQNSLLDSLNQQFSTVKLLELIKDQVIMGGDSDIENIEQQITEIVLQTSYTDHRYANGRNIKYNTEKISKKIRQRFIDGKVKIEVEEEQVKFKYQGGYAEQSNPYFQYEDIWSKIHPQERCNDSQRVIDGLFNTEEKLVLLSDLKLTMSFLQQTGGPPDKSLENYMRAFNVGKSFEIANFPGSLRLRHVLDLFEKAEDSLESHLVEKTDPKYERPLDEFEAFQLEKILKNINPIIDLPLLRSVLARLCIRQLTGTQSISADQLLFPYLFAADLNTYLFGIDPENPVLATLHPYFESSTVSLGQSHSVYLLVRDTDISLKAERDHLQEQERLVLEQNQKRIKQERQAKNQELHGGGNRQMEGTNATIGVQIRKKNLDEIAEVKIEESKVELKIGQVEEEEEKKQEAPEVKKRGRYAKPSEMKGQKK